MIRDPGIRDRQEQELILNRKQGWGLDNIEFEHGTEVPGILEVMWNDRVGVCDFGLAGVCQQKEWLSSVRIKMDKVVFTTQT